MRRLGLGLLLAALLALLGTGPARAAGEAPLAAVGSEEGAGSSRGGAPSGEALLRAAVEEQLGELEMERLNRFLAEMDQHVAAYLPRLDVDRILHGEIGPDPRAFFGDLVGYLFRELVANSRLLGELLLIAVLGALLQNLQASFGNRTAGEMAFAVTFLALVLVGFTGFRLVAGVARETVDRMVEFMLALLPVLSSLLVAAGAPGAAAVFHPLMVAVADGVAMVISRVFLPLVFFSTVIGVASHFHGHFPLSQVARFLRTLAMGALGLFFSVFLGVMVVRGAALAVADGIGLRAAKFLTATLIPVAGKMFADAVEVVVGGSLLIKNAVGVLGMVAVLVLVAFPLMKVASILLVYKLAAAAVQPVSDPRLVDALGHLETGIVFLFLGLCTVALMFFLVVTVTIGAGTLAFMLR